MAEKLRIGFIGAGEIVQLHYKAVSESDTMQLAGFWTVDRLKAAKRTADF